ncbi:MAG: exostosin family protein [Anaerolineae bacterium]|nr:exostosin family protein [Anaerolineae bacterium]
MVVPPRRLRLYADKNYIPKGKTHVTLLAPFWGRQTEDLDVIYHRRFDHFLEIGHSLFEMTSLDEADYAVLPSDWDTVEDDPKLPLAFAEKARQAGKDVIVFLWGPSLESVPIENSIVFRNSMLGSTRKRTEFPVPYWFEDFVEEYLDNKQVIRQKVAKPTVGFCGFAEPLNPTPQQALINLARKSRAALTGKTGNKAAGVFGRAIRTRAMQILDRNPNIATNFIIKDRFWAGAITPDGKPDNARLQASRQEYLRNMLDSDYVLVIRGAGNASFRLFETLCSGRIPILVDTDCVLPYEEHVDWKKYCVWVDQTELASIADKVLDFHNKLSASDFVELQHACRAFWKDWLSPAGFFQHFHLHFQGELAPRGSQPVSPAQVAHQR